MIIVYIYVSEDVVEDILEND